MLNRRHGGISKLYVIQQIADDWMLFPIFDDLDDAELQRAFNHAVVREDYEYAQEILAEMKLRNIRHESNI